MFVSDNGMELTSIAILRWSQETRIEWHCAPTSSSNTSWFAALHEAAIGPGLTTWALQQVVRFLGYTCRQTNVVVTAAHDPLPTWTSRLTDLKLPTGWR
jgi:hypothetical protein